MVVVQPQRGSRRGAEAIIRRVAARQYEVVEFRQLIAAGVPRGVIRELIARGWLIPLHRGVYAVGRADLVPRGVWLAATLYAGPAAPLSHGHGGALWAVCRAPKGPVHVSSLSNRRSTAGVTVHRRRHHPGWAWGHKERIPVTSLEWTIFDIAAIEPETTVRRAIEEAERLRILETGPMRRCYASRRGEPGAALVAEVMAEAAPAHFTRSEFEDLLRDVCREHGLPLPEMNDHALGHEVDAHWRDGLLIGECDSWDWHRTRQAFENDGARDVELQKAGYRVVRITWRRLTRQPEAVASDIAALLRRDAATTRRSS